MWRLTYKDDVPNSRYIHIHIPHVRFQIFSATSMWQMLLWALETIVRSIELEYDTTLSNRQDLYDFEHPWCYWCILRSIALGNRPQYFFNFWRQNDVSNVRNIVLNTAFKHPRGSNKTHLSEKGPFLPPSKMRRCPSPKIFEYAIDFNQLTNPGAAPIEMLASPKKNQILNTSGHAVYVQTDATTEKKPKYNVLSSVFKECQRADFAE